MHAANRGCKNYPCSIALRADWKINRYHLARLVSSNRDWFAYYRHTTPIFTHSLYVYAGETIMPPRVNPAGAKTTAINTLRSIIEKNNSECGCWVNKMIALLTACLFFEIRVHVLNRPFSKMAAENLNKSKLKTNTSTRKSTLTLVTLPSVSISGVISAEKM